MRDVPDADCSTTRTDIEIAARMWSGGGWARFLFPGFWLIYLGQPIQGVANHSHGAAAVVGYVVVGLFAACYLAAIQTSRLGRPHPFTVLYGLSFVLTAAGYVFAHGDGSVFLVYVAVLTIASKWRYARVVVIVLTAAAAALPRLLWNQPAQWGTALSVLLVSLAMWGFFNVIRANMELTAARAEVARLAAENERSRIARDLHDLLGHSLTTITVKAGLARRLAEHGDAERAFQEISEVEKLARRTLGDVRAAVSAHHEVTLTGELATAREVLRAAAIVSELPASVAETEPALSELFGWVVREAVTNVVRHSRASHVRITLGPTFVEIVDDGSGGGPGSGNGLRGLRERIEALGGTLTVGSTMTGFRLRAEVPGPPFPADAQAEVLAEAHVEADTDAAAESEPSRAPAR
jgi:two-component system, NarL family, sensor histidine kinase DesK